jgi:hypothetical protein
LVIRKSLRSFDQGKPADCGGVRDGLKGGKVSSFCRAGLAEALMTGALPQTPPKGNLPLRNPHFLLKKDERFFGVEWLMEL